jgi:hypothetical protein
MNKMEQYWVDTDTLKTIESDIYFSLGSRYYCDAACEVCYIQGNLDSIKSSGLQNIYKPITIELEALWKEVFSYFYTIRTDDDMHFYKYNFPEHYQWYTRNASKMEYSITDNAIIRYSKLLHEVKFKAMASITISSTFASKVQTEYLMKALKEIHSVSPIRKFKLINTSESGSLEPYAQLAKELGISILGHHDFRKGRVDLEEEWVTEQTSWISTEEGKVVQVYGDNTAPHFYYDRFYYSNDGASDFGVVPFHYVEAKVFYPEKFCADLIKGKQLIYNKWKDSNFKEYFAVTQEYKVNYPFNFIPGVMMPSYSKFCAKLVSRGWVKIPQGLYKEPDSVISIMEKK